MQPQDWTVGIGRTWWAQSSMTELWMPGNQKNAGAESRIVDNEAKSIWIDRFTACYDFFETAVSLRCRVVIGIGLGGVKLQLAEWRRQG
jgi:hypothetical protein